MLVGCVVSVAFGIRDDEYPFKTIGRHSLEYLLAIEYPKTVFICDGVEFGCLRVVNQMSYLTVGSLENTSRLVDVSLNWTINSTG